jgi:hypothetical protein
VMQYDCVPRMSLNSGNVSPAGMLLVRSLNVLAI